ncbi:immunoglobulin-like domain-containing protein [uncultured Bacteroides sp.]|uniref:immunoglobulin-like domain-containing protein n=1 Tax=uncultured Bacteroides sp. TaxID=162156 RepID=UPI0025EDDC2F|nr:immunoglobulin-like domain-containing protein [uncultured Bacteroides sp.]
MKLILSVILCMLLLGCQNNKKNSDIMSYPNDTTARKEQQIQQKKEEVTMITLRDEYHLPLSKIEVRITNHSNMDILTGVGYYIEYFTDNEWTRVPLNYAFVEIAIIVLPDSSEDYIIDLQANKHDYKKGLYRVVKRIKAGNKEVFLKAQFKIS